MYKLPSYDSDGSRFVCNFNLFEQFICNFKKICIYNICILKNLYLHLCVSRGYNVL